MKAPDSPLEAHLVRIDAKLSRIEAMLTEVLSLARRAADKENAPPEPQRFREAWFDDDHGKPQRGWETWGGEGTGWVRWFGPLPKGAQVIKAKGVQST